MTFSLQNRLVCVVAVASSPIAGTVRSINPSTGEVMGDHSLWSEPVAAAALDRAWAAWQSWRLLDVETRAKALAGLGDALLAHEDELAVTLTTEMGKPLQAARAEIRKTAAAVAVVIGQAPAALAPDLRLADDTERVEVRHDPLGPVLGIMPWNFPYWQSARLFLPALLAGNTVLIKPAPVTLGSALALQAVIDSAGLPEGVLQTVVVDTDLVAGLVADPRLRGVSLTGSARAGRAVAELAGRHLTKVVLELGGSDAFVVLPGADVGAAARAAVASRMQNGGQSCIAAKRFLVHRDLADEFVTHVVAAVAELIVGDPADPGVTIGPLVSAEALDALEEQVAASVRAGAVTAIGGHRIDRPGFYFEPTVLTGVDASMTCVTEEVFGPVAAVSTVDDVDDAIEQANASEYGLGASVWTDDPDIVRECASRLEAGQVFVNAMVASDARFPFGGVKNSGFGRELGVEGLREFTNVKLVRVVT